MFDFLKKLKEDDAQRQANDIEDWRLASPSVLDYDDPDNLSIAKAWHEVVNPQEIRAFAESAAGTSGGVRDFKPFTGAGGVGQVFKAAEQSKKPMKESVETIVNDLPSEVAPHPFSIKGLENQMQQQKELVGTFGEEYWKPEAKRAQRHYNRLLDLLEKAKSR